MAADLDSLDLAEMLQEERRQLSWIVEDMTALYMENSKIVAKIKNINEELEEFCIGTQENSYDDSNDDDFEDFPDVKDAWLEREDVLRVQLVEQLQNLYQDVSSLQQQHRHHGCHVPLQLWGHVTQSWCPPPARARWRTGKFRQTEKLLRWIDRKMPMPS
jgi:regulator of replication initiation timing